MAETKSKLEQKRERLEMYYERERIMLSPEGIKSYGVGSRNASRYDTALADIQKQIKTLENEVEELEGQQSGKTPRRAVAVVPHDW